MPKEIIILANSIEEAVREACQTLGVAEEKCNVEVIEKPKKSLFGKIKVQAKVKVTVKETIKLDIEKSIEKPSLTVDGKEVEVPTKEKYDAKLEVALNYLKEILSYMDIKNLDLVVEEGEESATITIKGDNLGAIIGRRGETLDAIQYLTSLVRNRIEGNYYRIVINCGNYREKREESLKELAMKMSEKVKKTGRSQTLEPMNPYERRIIHAVLSEIEGVTSKSRGEEPNRKIIIFSNDPKARNNNKSRNDGRRNNNGGNNRYSKPVYRENRKPEKTMEQILKEGRGETEKKAKLYEKIEF